MPSDERDSNLSRFPSLQHKTPATENSEMVNTGLASKSQLIRSPVHESTQENAVGHVTSSVNRLSPVFARSPMLTEHHPRHLNQCLILPLYNSILLWSVRRRILVFKPLITAKGVKTSVLNFVPLSLRIALMAWGSSFFNLKIKSRTNSKVSSLVLMKKTQE